MNYLELISFILTAVALGSIGTILYARKLSTYALVPSQFSEIGKIIGITTSTNPLFYSILLGISSSLVVNPVKKMLKTHDQTAILVLFTLSTLALTLLGQSVNFLGKQYEEGLIIAGIVISIYSIYYLKSRYYKFIMTLNGKEYCTLNSVRFEYQTAMLFFFTGTLTTIASYYLTPLACITLTIIPTLIAKPFSKNFKQTTINAGIISAILGTILYFVIA